MEILGDIVFGEIIIHGLSTLFGLDDILARIGLVQGALGAFAGPGDGDRLSFIGGHCWCNECEQKEPRDSRQYNDTFSHIDYVD